MKKMVSFCAAFTMLMASQNQAKTAELSLSKPILNAVEMSVRSASTMKQFYESLFGWKFVQHPEVKDHWLVFPDTFNDSGQIHRAPILLYEEKKNDVADGIYPYYRVNSLDEYLKKVKDLGGTVYVPKTKSSNQTYWAICKDLDGSLFGLCECVDYCRARFN